MLNLFHTSWAGGVTFMLDIDIGAIFSKKELTHSEYINGSTSECSLQEHFPNPSLSSWVHSWCIELGVRMLAPVAQPCASALHTVMAPGHSPPHSSLVWTQTGPFGRCSCRAEGLFLKNTAPMFGSIIKVTTFLASARTRSSKSATIRNAFWRP